jgi:hypothetical protein
MNQKTFGNTQERLFNQYSNVIWEEKKKSTTWRSAKYYQAIIKILLANDELIDHEQMREEQVKWEITNEQKE